MKSHVFEREKLQDAELPSGHQERNTSSGPKFASTSTLLIDHSVRKSLLGSYRQDYGL